MTAIYFSFRTHSLIMMLANYTDSIVYHLAFKPCTDEVLFVNKMQTLQAFGLQQLEQKHTAQKHTLANWLVGETTGYQ